MDSKQWQKIFRENTLMEGNLEFPKEDIKKIQKHLHGISDGNVDNDKQGPYIWVSIPSRSDMPSKEIAYKLRHNKSGYTLFGVSNRNFAKGFRNINDLINYFSGTSTRR